MLVFSFALTIGALLQAEKTNAAPASNSTLRPLQVGDIYQVVTRRTFKGKAKIKASDEVIPSDKNIEGKEEIAYYERILAFDRSTGDCRVLRLYDAHNESHKLGNKEESTNLRKQVRRIVINKTGTQKTVYSLDGALRFSELQFLKDHPILPILESSLPATSAEKNWNIPKFAVLEIAGMSSVRKGELVCEPLDPIKFKGKDLSQTAFSGQLEGLTDLGMVTDDVRGAIFVDSLTHRTHSFRIAGNRELFARDNKAMGSIDADFQLLVQYSFPDKAPLTELSDTVADSISPKPTSSQLLVSLEINELGIYLEHPRRWSFQHHTDKNALLISEGGGSISLNLEPEGNVPESKPLFDRILANLKDKRIEVKSQSEIQEQSNREGRIAQFQFSIKDETAERNLVYVIVQRGKSGVTLEAQIPSESDSEQIAEVEKLARSIRFVNPSSK